METLVRWDHERSLDWTNIVIPTMRGSDHVDKGGLYGSGNWFVRVGTNVRPSEYVTSSLVSSNVGTYCKYIMILTVTGNTYTVATAGVWIDTLAGP